MQEKVNKDRENRKPKDKTDINPILRSSTKFFFRRTFVGTSSVNFKEIAKKLFN